MELHEINTNPIYSAGWFFLKYQKVHRTRKGLFFKNRKERKLGMRDKLGDIKRIEFLEDYFYNDLPITLNEIRTQVEGLDKPKKFLFHFVKQVDTPYNTNKPNTDDENEHAINAQTFTKQTKNAQTINTQIVTKQQTLF